MTTDLRDRLQSSLGTTYTFDRELGGGGMSRVFAATETALGRKVVVKVLPPELAAGVSTERFKREISVAARLQHPHIVPLHSAGEMDGLPYFTMPFVEGESLRARLARRGELPVSESVRILREIASALAYAHEHGVVHRDIKPDNVLFSGDVAMVADFGVAKALSASSNGDHGGVTSLGVALGTPAYMAPEQATADPTTDHRADVYAFGVLAYEMLTGQPPFVGRNPSQLLAAHVTETPEPIARRRPNIPPLLAALVMQCLEKRPADRPQSAGEIVHALDDITTPSGGTAPTSATLAAADARVSSGAPVATGMRASWWTPRRSGLVTLAIVAITLGAGGIFAWMRPSTATATAGPKRIAVLPFENQGAADDEYFADGITDEIRGKLGAIPGIEVIARGSSTPYKKTPKTPQEIAKELGVRYLLTAVVRWEKGTAGQSVVHVTPELVEVSGNAAPSSRWQERFDQPLTNVFQVQADIAGRVASALNVALGSPARTQLAERPTANLAAYDEYLKGVAEQTLVTPSATSLRRMADHFERAVALDSAFVGAWVRLVPTLVNLYANGVPSPAVLQRARQAAERVATLAPNSVDAHVAMARVLRTEGQTKLALREYDLALAASPNDPLVLRAVSGARQSEGRWQEALDLTERAVALDPRSVPALASLSFVQLHLRRTADALATTTRALALAPASLNLLENQAIAHLQRGDVAAARRTAAGGVDLDQPSLVAYFALYWDLYWILDDAQQQLLLRLPMSAFDNDEATFALVHAQLSALQGNHERKRAYADTAQVKLAGQINDAPEDAQRHALRGLALAYLGRKDEALQEAARGAELVPKSKDAPTYGYLLHQRVRIYTEVGETERALDGLEELLGQPYFVTREWLRIDPNFAPLRGNPRFEKLAAGR